MGGDRGWRGGGRSPGHPPGKLQVANHFQEEKLVRASLEKHPPPPLRWSCLDPHTHV